MERLILSIYERTKHPQYEQIHLLNKDEKISVQALRNALYKLDLSGKLVLCLDSDLSKLFKEDYSFNDHGIYYDVFYNSNFDLHLHTLTEKTKKLRAKLAKKYTEAVHNELQLIEHDIIDIQSQISFVLVPVEQQTQKRDYERWLQYDKFIDPVDACNKAPLDPNYNAYIFDIETTGLDFEKDSLLMVGIKPVGSNEYYIEHNPSVGRLQFLVTWMLGKTIIGHNLLFDLSWLMHKAGIEFAPNIETIDTMLLAHVAGERSLSLKHLSMMYGNFKGRRNTMSADESYLVEDLLATELLYEKFKDSYSCFSGKLVCNAVKALAEAKISGVVLDKNRLFEVRDAYRQFDTPKYDFNVNSNRELSNYLLTNGVPLTAKTPTGDWKVDQKTLDSFKTYEVVQEYIDYIQELTIYEKFVKKYCQLESFTIRPDLRLSGTKTGRLSCENPNTQQIPNRSLFKDIFASRFGDKGLIASIDLDQAELRIAALLSNDEVYSKSLLSNDFHKLVASKTFGKPEKEVTKQERFVAKSVNFGGVLYGGSAAGIATRIKVATEVVSKVQEWYKKEFVKLTTWIESQKDLAVKTNQITTLFGRQRTLYELRWDEKRRIGVNTAVQSVASDVMLYIVVRLSGLLRQHKLKSKVLFPVHDELLLDIHREELEQVIQLLKQAFKDVLKTPIGKLELANKLPISGTLEWGKSWLYVKNEKYPCEGSCKISSLE